uniref:NACHT domain-containing protein n=1 Tax=Latimeria chalumnae TaxID=7897 RepID=H3ABX3_LATCH
IMENIFPLEKSGTQAPKTIMLKGISGIGKTIVTQKIIYDWASEKCCKQFYCVLSFHFQELNLIRWPISLKNLILEKYGELAPVLPELLQKPNILITLDGLDEFKHQLDFHGSKVYKSVDDVATVAEIVVNLLNQNLLPKATIFLTTRPTVSSVPKKLIDKNLVLAGFTSSGTKEYCLNYYKDIRIAGIVYNYISGYDSLSALSFIPLYCYIICTLVEKIVTKGKDQLPSYRPPLTVTEVYHQYLINALQHHGRGTEVPSQQDPSQVIGISVKQAIFRLGKLAYKGLLSNMILFDEEMLNYYGLSLNSLPSSFLTNVFTTQQYGEQCLYSFFHVTLQEFFAALYCVIEIGDNDQTLIECLNAWCLGEVHQSGNIHLLEDITQDSGNLQEQLQTFTKFFVGLLKLIKDKSLTGLIESNNDNILFLLKKWFTVCFEDETLTKHHFLILANCLFEFQEYSIVKSTSPNINEIQLENIKLFPLDCVAINYALK